MEQNLQRRSGVALWRQIADSISSDIVRNIQDPNGKLPGEIALAARYGVNRHTVRTALRALSEQGLLETRHGDGTYVLRKPHVVYPLGRRTRFSDGIGDQAGAKRGRLVSSMLEPAEAKVAQGLALHPGTQVLRLDTISEADGYPMTRSTSWFDADRFANMADIFSRTGSITAALKHYGIDDYFRKSTRIHARHATTAEIAELKLSAGAIVLVTHAVNATPEGEPLQYSITRFPADKVTLSIETDIAQ